MYENGPQHRHFILKSSGDFKHQEEWDYPAGLVWTKVVIVAEGLNG